MLARLKPFDGKRYVRRSYTVFGIKFIGDRGWYQVDNDVSEYLKTVVQRDEDPDSAPAFDVCTAEEAKAIDARERAKATRHEAAQAEEARPAMRVHNVARPSAANAARAAVASQAADMTTDDLGSSSTPAAHLEEILGPADAAPGLSGDFDDDMAGDAEPPPAATAAPSTPAPAKKSHHKPKKPGELL